MTGREEIIETDVSHELAESFLEYSMSVIVSRALPDVRDGLKPVHRRILWSMYQQGIRPGTPYKKCARIVGDTIGRYHPHGDSAVYEALVRLAQPWSMRLTLVDGHGNFGSLDDGPAAMRYCVTGDTLVRLADGGTVAIADLAPGAPLSSDIPIDVDVLGRHGEPVHASMLFNSGLHPVRKLTTVEGFELRGTGNHPVLTLTDGPDGVPAFAWKLLDDVTTGDLVVLSRQQSADAPASAGQLGLAADAGASHPERIPAWVWAAPRAVKRAFLDTALEHDDANGHWLEPGARLNSRVRGAQLAKDIQVLLTEFGVVTRRFWDASRYRYGLETAHTSLGAAQGVHLARVASCAPDGTEVVYSIRVDTDEHAFVAGAVINHNTESRMDVAAMAMVEELSEDTVDMRPNYDGTETEPTVMPAAFPNLIVNGGTGIAVGMATNMAPHNLVEAVAAIQEMIKNPAVTLDDVMAHIKGPDLPSGCTIIGLDGVREAYETGRGSFRMRATCEIIDVTARKKGIAVTELPFNVGPEKVVARVKDLVNDKKLNGVSDIKDYSDLKSGLRLVIEVKTGFNPHAVLDELYRYTPLEESFGINNVALVDGQPQTLGMLDLCRHFIGHRVVVVRRRTEFRLRKAQARAHIVEGLVIALAAIDEVVALIRASKDSATARTRLMSTFSLTQVQAEAILEMTLRRLTSLEVTKLKDELKELKRQIAEFEKILSSEKNIKAVVSEELDRVVDAFGTPRRTRLLKEAPASSAEAAALEVSDDPCLVALSAQGLVGRFEPAAHKGKLAKADILVSQVASTNRSTVGLVTSTGRLVRVSVLELPAAVGTGKGLKADDVFGLEPGEKPVALIDARPGRVVTLATRTGQVKRVRTADFPKALDTRPIVGLSGDDTVIGASCLPEADSDAASIVLIASDGQLLRFPGSVVTPKGMPAGAMAGIRLAAGTHLAGFAVIADGTDADVVLVSDANAVKRSKLADYPAKGRGTGGVRAMTFRKGEAQISAAAVSAQPIVAVGTTGTPVAIPSEHARRDASGTPVEDGVVSFGFARHVAG